jgi:hypothetical protein
MIERAVPSHHLVPLSQGYFISLGTWDSGRFIGTGRGTEAGQLDENTNKTSRRAGRDAGQRAGQRCPRGVPATGCLGQSKRFGNLVPTGQVRKDGAA